MDILTVAILAGCAGFFAAAGLAIIPLRRAERTMQNAQNALDRMDAGYTEMRDQLDQSRRDRDHIRADFRAFRSRAYVRNAKGQIKRWTGLNG